MRRFVLCVVIVGAALAAFSLRAAQEHRATPGPAAFDVQRAVHDVCHCEPWLAAAPATESVTEVGQPQRARTHPRLPRTLALALVMVYVGLLSRHVTGRSVLGPRRTGSAEAWRQRLTRGPPTATSSCA